MTTTLHPNLPITIDGEIATVSITRPEAMNAFDMGMWIGLAETMEALSAMEALRCVILRGSTPAAFSAGADIKAFETERGSPESEALYARAFNRGMQSIRLCQHPVIAAILSGDVDRFYAEVKRLAALPKPERDAALAPYRETPTAAG